MFFFLLLLMLVVGANLESIDDDPRCPPGLLLNLNYPDPDNCSKYYKCRRTGELLQLNCNAGMEYDYINSVKI